MARLSWLYTEMVYCQTAVTHPLLTGLNVEQLRWLRPTHYHHYTKPPNQSVTNSYINVQQISKSPNYFLINSCIIRQRQYTSNWTDKEH